MLMWLTRVFSAVRCRNAIVTVAVLLPLAASARAQVPASSPASRPDADAAPRVVAANAPVETDLDLEGIVFQPLPPLHAAPVVAGVPAWTAPCSIDPAVVAMMNESGNVLDVELPLGPGSSAVARLRRFDAVAPDATLVLEGAGGVRTPLTLTVSTWTGHLLDDPDSEVFLGLSPTQAQGWITTRGTTFLIATRFTPTGPLTLAYDQNDFDLPGEVSPPSCAGAISPPGDTPPPPTGEAGYAPRVACLSFRVAIDTDEEFAALAGGGQNAAEYAVILVAASSSLYTREVNMGLQLGFLRIWSAPDPWTAANTADQLNEFLTYWKANMPFVPRASAHLLSGRALGGGIAYVRQACSSDYGYAVSANLAGAFPFPILDNASSNWDLKVVTHEWGHQFGTGHTHNSCEYNPIIDACGLRPTSSSCEYGTQDCTVATAQNGTIMSYCHTCSGGMRNVKMAFGPRVVDRIASYVSAAPCASWYDPPILANIAASPAATVCAGTPITLTANASGSNLRFQWFRNGSRVFGATTPSFTIASPVNGDRWDVMVYAPCGVILTQGTPMGVVISTAASGVGFGPGGTVAIADAAGNANGRIDPGEVAVALTIPVRNAGPSVASGVTATLTSNTPTVTIANATASYPAIAACAGTASNPSPFLINVATNHPCGTPISLTLTVTSAQGSNAFTFSLPVGIPGSVAAPVTVSYTGPIVPIPDNLVGGRAAYLAVTGLAGTIVDVDFRFDGSDCNAAVGSTTVGLDHTYVGDLSVSLASPAGTTVNLMNRPGTEFNSGLNFCGTRLDDDAPNSIQAIVPADNPWTGTYAPANELAAFNGENPEGTWTLRVTDTGATDTGNIRAFSLIITVRTSSSCTPFCQSPSITAQPTSRTVCVNTSTTFTLTPAGSAPFTYQWRKAGVTIDGATSASFTIPSVAAADAASYDCVVSNACGSVTSTAATLAVNSAPSITTQPASTVSCAGATASFTVAATGTTPLTYQWRKNGAAIPSATSPTYTIPSVVAADAGAFDCVVTNACGTATSAAATLTVSGTVLSFTTQPVSLTRCAREEANFSVTVTGSSPTFQWRKDGVAIPGATASIFTIPSVQAVDIGGYDCVVTNTCGSVSSSIALLRVNVPPSITSNPSHVSACPGTAASFSVTAGGTRTLTYQWRKDGTPITGATAATYTIASVAATDAASYDCVVTNGCGNATSLPAMLSVGGHWLPGDALAGVGGEVYATVAWDPDGAGPLGTMVVAGGAFTAAGGVNANRIAMFDPQTSTWSALGSGMNGPVYALAVLRSGDLVAAGSFNTAGGLAANGIARWNGSSWSVLGSGLSGPVYALAVLANGDTVAAGGFATAGGVPSNFIARWNGVSWSAMGAGMDNEVRALTVLPGGDLVAGGTFTLAGGLLANRIARWNGASWSALGSGVNNTVYALNQLQGGDLVVGGSFTTAGGLAANRIARWNGAAWSTFSTGMNGDVYALTLLPNGNLVAGGAFSTAGSSTAAWLASWNGSAWSSLGAGVEGGIFAFALLPGGDLIAGGTFLSAGGASAGRIARWNGAAWSTMGSGLGGRVLALASNSSGETFVGGTVTAAGAVTLNNVGKWNGATWSSLGSGANGTVNALALLPGGDLVAGGSFTAAGGTPATAIARWNGTAWSALGTGLNSAVNALAVLSNGELVAGGSFTTAGGAAVNRVARWNGTAWSALGVGLSGGVNALALLPSGDLVAGGSFTFAGVAPTPGIARWNGVSWFSLGTGVNGTVNALAVLPGGVLVAGGSFTTAGGVAVSNVARWNGSAWSAMGTGLGGIVNALTVLPSGEVIAGGSFLTAGSATVNRVAKWDGISWSSLGAGMDNTVLALSPLSGGDFIAGGGFATAGGRVAANLARYAASGAPAVAAQPASQSSCTGQTLTLVAAPANGYPNASFQWRRNGVNVVNGTQGASAGGGTVSGASGSFPSPTAASSTTLTIASLASSDAGSYTCVFSNACGSVTTSAAAVAINVSPVITSHPVSRASCAGTSATFSLVAFGTPTPSFQWRKGGVNINGATAASYTIASVAVSDAASYDCVVTNACGSVTSTPATLTVNTAPAITAQPTARSACVGTSTTFTLAATGTPTPSFQWRKGGVNINGANSASFTIAAVATADAGSYDCVVTNTCGTVTSSAAALSLNAAVSITTQPTARTVCAGTSTTFTVAAIGTPAPSFQWRKGGVNINGATSASYAIASVATGDAASYDCVVTNACGSVTSGAAALMVNTAPTITTHPASRAACPGASTTFTVAATNTPTPTFQWRKGGVNISGATSASFTIPSVMAADAASYDCVVTNSCGSVTSSTATLSLNAAPVITTQPVPQIVCLGSSVTLSIAATGTPVPTFQWRQGGVTIAGATSASFTIASVMAADAASYDCVVTNSCASVTSVSVSVSVGAAPSNDRVSNPLPLVPGVMLDGNTSCATNDATDAPVCAAQPVTAPGLWYRLAGTGTSVTVATCGSALDTRLSAFCGTPGSFTCVAGNDDSCSLQSSVTFCTQAGADYFILVHGFGTAVGSFAILATASPSPCTNPVACLPVGACCADNGCTQLSAAQCDQLGGTFLGVGTPCDTVSYNDLFRSPGPFPLPILDFTTTNASITAPPGSGLVDGLAVRLNLLHTSVGNLTITLTHGATSVRLVAASGSGADLDGAYTFSDLATTPFAVVASGGAQVPSGIFQPSGSLAAFNGQPFDGRWILSVRDGADGDSGQLREFTLISVVTSPACNSCPPCIADYNLDGGIDAGDIGAFFDAWESSQPCTDVNGDGGIDFGDINDFFAAWENGGC